MVRNAKHIVILILVVAVMLKDKAPRFDFIIFWTAICAVFLFLLWFELKLSFTESEADASEAEKIFKEERKWWKEVRSR